MKFGFSSAYKVGGNNFDHEVHGEDYEENEENAQEVHFAQIGRYDIQHLPATRLTQHVVLQHQHLSSRDNYYIRNLNEGLTLMLYYLRKNLKPNMMFTSCGLAFYFFLLLEEKNYKISRSLRKTNKSLVL